MSRKSNNPPVIIELDHELAEFILSNCDANISIGLNFLQSVSRETAEKIVWQLEKFKKLKKIVQDAQGEII